VKEQDPSKMTPFNLNNELSLDKKMVAVLSDLSKNPIGKISGVEMPSKDLDSVSNLSMASGLKKRELKAAQKLI
jgi:hypothetical protein